MLGLELGLLLARLVTSRSVIPGDQHPPRAVGVAFSRENTRKSLAIFFISSSRRSSSCKIAPTALDLSSGAFVFVCAVPLIFARFTRRKSFVAGNMHECLLDWHRWQPVRGGALVIA